MFTATTVSKAGRRGIAFLLSASLAVSGTLYSPATTAAKKATAIRLNAPFTERDTAVASTLTMKKGSSFRIKTSVTPKAAGKKITYKSSKKKIATVSKKGVIKAKKCGKTRITITPKGSKKIKAVITVTVVKKLKKVKKIALDKKTLTLIPGSKSTLSAKIVSPKKPTTKKLNWYSSNKKVATVSKKGVVTAKSKGNATITATAADGRGAKATCRVTVQAETSTLSSGQPGVKETPGTSGEPTGSQSPAVTDPSGTTSPSDTPKDPDNSQNPTAVPDTFAILVPGERTGIKQGETLALTASGADRVNWSVTGDAGATIDAAGQLTVAKDVEAGTSLTVTAQAAEDSEKKDTKKLTVVENQTPVLTDRSIQLNQVSDENLTGLTFRSEKAYSTVTDPERGSVTRFDASQGYTSNSYDVLAWATVDPAWAGKTVTISAYMKYEASEDINGNMNLVINERWGYTNPAYKYNAEPDTWYHVTGTYTLPEYKESRYNGDNNKLYITRDTEHMATGKNAVYYIDDLVFSVEKADIEKVTLSTAGDADEIYQNHDLQCSATVSGTGVPSQKVTYSINPPVAGATISDTGLLSVKNAAAGATINITAASVEDPEKKDTKAITVLAQTIDKVTVTAEGNPEVIYQDSELQFAASVNATGNPDTTVTWKLEGGTTGITLSKTGLLTVGKQAPDNTKLKITATSNFDKSQSAMYEITVKANKIKNVTVSAAGGQTTIEPGSSLNLSAAADNEGTNASQDVTWSIVPSAVEGVSLTPNKNVCSLAVANTVANDVTITVRATSVFDPTQYGEITITVKAVEVETFDFNKLKVEYFENFDGENTTLNSVQEDGVLSWKATVPSDPNFYPGFDSGIIGIYQRQGIKDLSDSDSASNYYKAFLGSTDDYIQFSIKNVENIEKTFELSFFFRFMDIDADEEYISVKMKNDTSYVKYELPLKLISTDAKGKNTTLKKDLLIPFHCARYTSTNLEYYEMISSVTVPAGETVNLRLMLDGELPTCLSPDHTDDGYGDIPHPCTVAIDNICVSSGNFPVVSMKAGEQYSLKLNTLDGDTVKYYTNSYLAQYTHGESATCHRFDTTVATVDDKGVVTANTVGETACIAEITHANGEIERRQCIIRVEE